MKSLFPRDGLLTRCDPTARPAFCSRRIAWIILVLELAFEVLIRPTGYDALTHSEKAYAPSTARFINRFHLCTEILALALYIPELCCVFKRVSCGSDIPLTLIYASLRSVLGPNRVQAFIGHCIFAFVRLRIFGLVRHWKQMWIQSALMRQKKESRCHGFLMPPLEDRKAVGAFRQQQRQQNSSEIDCRTTKKLKTDCEAATVSVRA